MASSIAGSQEARRTENLAFVYQEMITAIERMRTNRMQVPDAASFRHQVKEILRNAKDESLRRGYSSGAATYAERAVVFFLDESILRLQNPAFRDWPRQPLQEDLYGEHKGGEVFFQHLKELLGHQDSQEIGDVLEVYQLCLLLGFVGKYSLGGGGELQGIINFTADKIRRIRQTSGELSRNWRLPAENISTDTKDPWLKRLVIAAVSSAAVALLLFLIYKFTLGGGVSQLGNLVG